MANELLETIRAMPKIELHRHLEGSLRIETLVEIAEQYDFEMPEYEVETLRPFVQVMAGQPRTPQNFIGKFSTLRQFYLSPEIIRRLTREVIIDAANDNVKYFELRFTPSTLCKIIQCPPEDTIRWVCEVARETSALHDIDVSLIVSINRHEAIEIGERVVDAAINLQHLGIVGLDLAGLEKGYRASDFKHLFERGHQAGLMLTIHAGEWEGVQSVWDTITGIRSVKRIGHGVRVTEDRGVMAVLRDRQIVLEVCPSSNVDSGVVASFDSHPLIDLLRAGVPMTLNTDDPLVSNVTLSDEMMRAITYFRLTIDDLKYLTMTAARAAFLPDKKRNQLVNKFRGWLYDSNG